MPDKHPSLIKIGKRIRELRKAKGFSQEGFAYEIGLDRTYMGGATLNLIRIAKALKIEVGELFPSIKVLHIE
jgi:transcriptional regulator with XRE-family HTH domain